MGIVQKILGLNPEVERFKKTIQDRINDENFSIILYQVGAWGSPQRGTKIFPGLADASFRDTVSLWLDHAYPNHEYKFNKPDDLDEWTFVLKTKASDALKESTAVKIFREAVEQHEEGAERIKKAIQLLMAEQHPDVEASSIAVIKESKIVLWCEYLKMHAMGHDMGVKVTLFTQPVKYPVLLYLEKT